MQGDGLGKYPFLGTDDFYFTLTGEQESDLQVYWQDNTLRIVSKSPGEVTLHLKDLRDTYQFPAGGCVITDFADGRSSSNNQKQFPARRRPRRAGVCSGVPCAPWAVTSFRIPSPTAPAPGLSLRGRFAPVAISGRQLCFRRKYPIIRPSTARFPRRFAPRNDKPEGPAPLNQWRKYCCSPRRSGNTATFFSRAAASPAGTFSIYRTAYY